jgi:hypothetical protein
MLQFCLWLKCLLFWLVEYWANSLQNVNFLHLFSRVKETDCAEWILFMWEGVCVVEKWYFCNTYTHTCMLCLSMILYTQTEKQPVCRDRKIFFCSKFLDHDQISLSTSSWMLKSYFALGQNCFFLYPSDFIISPAPSIWSGYSVWSSKIVSECTRYFLKERKECWIISILNMLFTVT